MAVEVLNKNIVECAEEAIQSGGSDFVRWVYEYICENIKGDARFLYCIVAIVPQIGSNTGKLIQHPKNSAIRSNRSNLDIYDGVKQQLIDVFDPKLNIETFSSSTSVFFSFRVPITYGFGKPIGSIVFITNKENNETFSFVKSLVDNLSSLIRSVKIQIAFEKLSDNLQHISEDTVDMSKRIIENARIAIGSKDVGLWRVTEDNMLMELVVATKTFNADMSIGTGMAGTCVQKEKIIKINNLQDEKETIKYCPFGVEHKKLVTKMGWHSAIFFPIALQKFSAGCFAVYSGREAGLNDLDCLIAKAFASQIEYSYTLNETEKLVILKDHLNRIAPAMDAAIDAVGNLHDADDELIDALNSMSLLEQKTGGNESLTAIKMNIKAANSLIKKFKDDIKFSRTDKIRVKYRNVKEYINPVILRTKTAAYSKGIVLNFSCPEDIEGEFDVERIKRAIRNVIENSIDCLIPVKQKQKYIYCGVRLSEDETNIVFTIEDNGPGIELNIRDSIFDIFFTTKDEDGFGLGLNMTFNTIRAHKGHINVDSRTGKGAYTKIIMSIPVLQ